MNKAELVKKEKRKIPDNLLDYIQEEVGRVEYGKIVIELRGEGNIDIVTEKRKRFPKEVYHWG